MVQIILLGVLKGLSGDTCKMESASPLLEVMHELNLKHWR